VKVFISRFLNSAVVVLLVAADGFPVKGLGSQRRVTGDNTTQAHEIAELIFSSVGVRPGFRFRYVHSNGCMFSNFGLSRYSTEDLLTWGKNGTTPLAGRSCSHSLLTC